MSLKALLLSGVWGNGAFPYSCNNFVMLFFVASGVDYPMGKERLYSPAGAFIL